MPTLEYMVFGKKLENPTPAQKCLLIGLGAGAFVTAFWMSPILVPTHVLLRKLGRNGFYDAERKMLHLDRNSFKRQGS